MKTKRFLSVLIAVLMLVSCFAVSASADDNAAIKPTQGDLTIHLFKGDNAIDQNDTETGASKSYNGEAIDNVTFSVIQVEDNADPTNAAGANAKAGASAVNGTTGSGSNAAGTIKFAALPAGRYKVSVTDKPTNVGNIATFLVDVPITTPDGKGYNADVHVYPKVAVTNIGEPTITKAVAPVTNNTVGTYKMSANLEKDQYASWKITVTVPEGIENFTKFIVTDTIDSRLTYKADSIAVTGGTLKNSATPSVANNKFALDFEISSLEAGTDVVITYQTQITNNLAGVKIPNHTDLTYNNDPNHTAADKVINNHSDDNNPDDPSNPDNPYGPDNPYDPTNPQGPANPEKDPYVWTGKIVVIKTIGNTTNYLKGAKFALYKDSACTRPYELGGVDQTLTTVASADGVSITGLKDGDYWLLETEAPAGYELNGTPIKFTISDANANGTDNAMIVTKTVPNIPSTKLPVTGGMGVGMFALIGAALALAGVVFMKKTGKSEA